MRRCLLSDLDGTIADTAPAIYASLHVTCARVGVEVAGDADLSFALGPPLHQSLRRLGVHPARMDEAIAIFEQAHTERLDLIVAMPGAGEVLGELAGWGVPVGVATIKPQPIAELVLAEIGLREHVTVVRGRSDDLDRRTKTDLLREAVSAIGAPAAVYVGDHDNDEEAAAALGIPFLRYPDHPWTEIRMAVHDRLTILSRESYRSDTLGS